MAARTSLGFAGGVGTTGVASVELINSSTTVTVRIKRIRAWLKAATASTYGIGRPAAAGITPTAPVALLDEGNFQTGVVKKAVAWATPPTVPAAFLAVRTTPATIGFEIDFEFEKGVRLAPGETLVLWNSGTNSTLDVSVYADEPDVMTVTAS